MMNLGSQPRGLYNFISDIRNAQTKEEERSRVDKELANIRQKFAASSNLSSYQKKKYVWKMCYIYMLGYEVDFGHLEFISLLSSTKFQEKSVGYMAVALLLKPGDEMITLVINSIRNDIVGTNHPGQCLAFSAVANLGGNEFGESLFADVAKYVEKPLDDFARVNVPGAPPMTHAHFLSMKMLTLKKATLCLLRLFRNSPDALELGEWSGRLQAILEMNDLGVVTSALSLAIAFAARDPVPFTRCVSSVVNLLVSLSTHNNCGPDYLYYRIPSPWIQVKCLKFLQYYRLTEMGPAAESLLEQISRTFGRKNVESAEVDKAGSANKDNSDHSILFETVSLVVVLGQECDPSIRQQALRLLGKYIAVKDANIRCNCLHDSAGISRLDAMVRLVRISGAEDVLDHLDTVIDACKDADVSVARKSLDLVFVMTNESNVTQVVSELLVLLNTAAESLKEEVVVKIAILAEKYTSDLAWYVDSLLQVVLNAGDFVDEDVWFRVVQVVTNHPEVQEYASARLLEAVQSRVAHETTVALAGYILGEFGVSVCEREGSGGFDQFSALHQHFSKTNHKIQALLLTAYVKLANFYPDTRPAIEEVFERYSTSPVLEIQQRACEYLALVKLNNAEVMEVVLNSMPPYSEEKESSLISRIGKGEKDSTDRSQTKTQPTEEPAEPKVSMSLGSPGAGPRGGRNKTADLLSLDDDEEEEPPAPQPIVQQQSPRAQPSIQQLVLDEDSPFDVTSPPVSSPGGVTILTAAEIAAARQGVVAFSLIPAGQKAVVFENEVLRVSASAEYRAHQGRISVFLYNKRETISGLVVDLPAPEALVVRKQDPQPIIAPHEEIKLLLAVDSMRPFLDPPLLVYTFSSPHGKFSYSLPLPVTVASFLEPVVVEKADYMARWKSLEGEDRESQEVFTSSQQVTPQLLNNLRQNIAAALHLGISPGLDSETTATASCTFRTGTPGPDGATLVSVGALVRVEGDVANSRFRVTARARNGKVAVAIKELLKAHLA